MLIHADADAFFASVEVRDDPTLRGRPFVVASVVVACPSYEARALGVHGGMPLRQAERVAPGLVVVPPRYAAYQDASERLFALFRSVTSWVEPGSMEEAFLDARPRGLDPSATARVLRQRTRKEVGLPVSMGVGMTKLMAKVASRRAKPDGLVVISGGEDRVVRRALRVEELWGIGRESAAALVARGIRTVADLEGREVRDLSALVGTLAGRRLAAIAAGTDDACVRLPGPRRSAGAQRTISPATRSRSAVEEVFAELLDTALGRVPGHGVEATRLDVEVRFDDGGAATTSTRIEPATRDGPAIADRAHGALAGLPFEDDGRGVALVGLQVAFRPCRMDPDQLALPF